MKKIVASLALIILTVIIFLMLIILCSSLVENVLLPSDYLFYENGPIASTLLAPLLILPSLCISCLIIFLFNKNKPSDDRNDFSIVLVVKKLGKWNALIIAVWVLMIYVSFTSLTYVTKDQIVFVSPLNLKGQSYHYSDVDKIETGFGDKRIAIVEHLKDGNFYYIVSVEGHTAVFHVPSVNPDIARYEDSYLELEEFDQALRQYNISKASSPVGHEKCDFDQRYVERFLRIIESK